MKRPDPILISSVLLLALCLVRAHGQPQILDARPTGSDMVIRFNSPAPFNSRLEVSEDLIRWNPLHTFAGSASTRSHPDNRASYLAHRYYRVVQLETTNAFTGDHVATAEGDVIVHPLFHASVALQWNGKTIYVDPDDDGAFLSRYQGLPQADLIAVTHSHGDHFSSSRIDALRKTGTIIVVPVSGVFTSLSAGARATAFVHANGATTNVLGITVEAVPAYNGNHPRGNGNGYVLTMGGKRFYFSGDTGAIPETRALSQIDVAFLCINLPFTMSVTDAASVTRDFRPRVVYPYHYRNQDGSLSNLNTYRQQVGTAGEVEVRQRAWY